LDKWESQRYLGWAQFQFLNMMLSKKQLGESNVMKRYIILAIFILFQIINAQGPLETALVKMGHVWVGVKANGDKGNFDYRAGFFPNDYEIIGIRGQYRDVWSGAGFRLATTNWEDPFIQDSIHSVSIFGPTTLEYPGWSQGKIVKDLTNYIRFGYPSQVVDFEPLDLPDFGDIDPSKFGDKTYDQIVEVTSENILGVQLNRKVLAWSQNFNDDYVIVDVEFTNVSGDTLTEFYINIESNGDNAFRSNGSNPSPGSSERFDPATTWQHYYGGRVGDSLRVFYEYSADDPNIEGDNMGAPVLSQNGRLINPKFVWYSILHASEKPYLNSADDVDDFLQPKVTYIGTATRIPDPGSKEVDDEYGSKSFWAIRGEYSKYYPMSGDTIPGTFHGLNSDELGTNDYANYEAGTQQNTNSKMWSSFGPYEFLPDHKIRLAIANGFSGLSYRSGQEVGKNWADQTIEDPPGIPDPVSGFFPTNFAFPVGATEYDKRKNRWISTGVDSVMQSASRANWNFNGGYKIPQAPAPPTSVEITGLGTGVEIRWEDAEAELMDNFAGYRIMRRLSAMDTLFYEVVYDSDQTDKEAVHLYIDKDVLIGAQYYYYVQAKARIDENEMNAHPSSRGKMLYSSRVLQPNLQYINPPHFSQDTLSNIRIAPNPYNINDPLLPGQGWTDQRGIQFFNLPDEVTIKIFTENGDLVKTIYHKSSVLSGYEKWDMISRNQQVISSGVYIAVFETPLGTVEFQKFLVVR